MKDVSSNLTSLRPIPSVLDNTRAKDLRGKEPNKGFLDHLSALQKTVPSTTDLQTVPLPGLKFSNHAIDRMRSRGIRYSPEEMAKIEGAVNKAAAKGAKDTLLLTDKSALIVSVKENTVVTVMDKAALKDNVFTKIDSTVVI
jgi:flagellar operon protein